MKGNKRFTLDDENDYIIFDNNTITDMGIKELYWLIDCDQRQKLVDLLNELAEENKKLKQVNEMLQMDSAMTERNLIDENEELRKENDKLHQKIFEMRTDIALERTEISKQNYTVKKNEKEFLNAKEFLDEIERW